MRAHSLFAYTADAGRLADWRPLFGMLAAYCAIVIVLAVTGRQKRGFGPTYLLPRISSSLERLTGIPGWAGAAVGTASFGLLVAGMGFYNDVAWHVALGRDKALFTAPHTAIIVGLFLIFAAAVLGTVMARLDGVRTGLRIRNASIPWSMIALGLFGGSALAGFPLDDLWHAFYGIDVTMWSPTHLLMILGAAFSPIASWLALAEAGVRPSDNRWARGVYVAVAVMTLLGLTAAQGEFSFGVPQFQQLYHPVLIVLAAGIALTTTRIVIGPWWALLVAVIGAGIGTGNLFGRAQVSRPAAVYVACAIAVELTGLIVGTERRLRFAVVAGGGIATLGLAGEWAWNQGAFQPWTTALLPDALLLGLLAAVAAAVLGVAFGSTVAGRRALRGIVVALAGVAIVFCLAWPLPRTSLDARAQVKLASVDDGVTVTARVDPPDAARDARWFQAMAWQGGGMVAADMKEQSPGVYASERPVPVGGVWKTVLRIQKGTATASIPIWFPKDAAIGEPEIPAVDRTAPFELEQKYLLREQHAGAGWFAPLVYAALLFIALLWITSVVVAARQVSGTERRVPAPEFFAA